jgi:hypothetical protein
MKLTEKWKLHAAPHPKIDCGVLSGQSERQVSCGFKSTAMFDAKVEAHFFRFRSSSMA